MKKDLNDVFTDIDDKLIAQAKPVAQKPTELKAAPRPKAALWKKVTAAAASVAVLGTGGVLTYHGITTAAERRLQLEVNRNNSDSDTYNVKVDSTGLTKVFESYGLNAANCNVSFTMDEFPDKELNVNSRGVYIQIDGSGQLVKVIGGKAVKSAFLYDATGDGLRDLCVTLEYGSGLYRNSVKIFDIAKDRIYELSSKTDNYRIMGAIDMEFTQTLVPKGFAGTTIPESELSVFTYGGEKDAVRSLNFKKGEIGISDEEGAGDFTLAVENVLADWDEGDPKKLWTSGDGEKTFTLPKLPGVEVRVSENSFDVLENGKPIEFLELNYRNGTIVRYNSVYSADVDLDGICELIVDCDLDVFTQSNGETKSNIAVYDPVSHYSVSENASISNIDVYLTLYEDELRLSVTSRFGNYNDTIDSCSHYEHWWEEVYRAVSNYEENGVNESSRNIPIELDLSKANARNYEFTIEQFPDKRFYVTPDSKIIDDSGKVLIEAPSLKNAFLYDYNEDGKRDICVTAGYNGITYVEVYDVENAVNKYSAAKKNEVASRYLYAAAYDVPCLDIRETRGGDDWSVCGNMITEMCKSEKPTIEELLFICDSDKLASGSVKKVRINGIELGFVGGENSMSLGYEQTIFMGSRYISIADNILNAYMCDTDDDGISEIWMTRRDGDRTTITVLIPTGGLPLYDAPDDGVSRRLEIVDNEIVINNGTSTEPFDLSELIKCG